MIIAMPTSRPEEPDYVRECEQSLLCAAARLKQELTELMRSERRAAEELAGALVLPADYPLGDTFIGFLTSRAHMCGWEQATVREVLPLVVAKVTVPVLENGPNDPPVSG